MKGNIIASVLGFVAVGAIGAYGVVSIVQDTNVVTPSILNVESASLHLEVSAEALWATENNSFSTVTDTQGLMNDEWRMPNLSLVAGQTHQLVFTIENKSNSATSIEIRGLAYDSEITSETNYRFRTWVEAEKNTVVEDVENITESHKNYKYDYLASMETLTITVNYQLVSENLPIMPITQNITMGFNIVLPGDES